MCSLTHSMLFLKCDLIQNKLKVEQIVHSWELYTVYNFSVCVCKLFCTVSIPKVLTVNNIWLFFLLSLHFKDNTVCVNEHISFNSVVVTPLSYILHFNYILTRSTYPAVISRNFSKGQIPFQGVTTVFCSCLLYVS